MLYTRRVVARRLILGVVLGEGAFLTGEVIGEGRLPQEIPPPEERLREEAVVDVSGNSLEKLSSPSISKIAAGANTSRLPIRN